MTRPIQSEPIQSEEQGGRPEKAYVVFSTHWDREWIQPFEQYRYRLVNLVDNLLEILRQEKDIWFFFDGQTVFLEDYLEIRPENKAVLQRYASERRLIVGPWYVLADQFLESAEATVRNLLIGRKTALEFGGAASVGYVPDSFGSIASLPSILNGFGIRSANFGRGRTRSTRAKDALFWWQWKDGSRVLALNRGYGNAISLSYPDIWRDIHACVPTQETARAASQAILQAERETSPLPLYFLSAGLDHMEMRAGMAEIVRALNAGQTRTEFVVSDPQQYFQEAERYVTQHGIDLEVVEGEMRGDAGSPMDLQGVLSTNQDVKRENRRCEALLTGILEPLSALTRVLSGVSQEHFLEYLWKTLLKNHPHDSICACSVDSVIADVMARFRHVAELAEVMAEQMLRQLVTPRRDAADLAVPCVTLYNPTTERHTSHFGMRVRLPMRLRHDKYVLVADNHKIVGEAQRVAVKNVDLESLSATNAALGVMLSKNSLEERDPGESFSVLDIEGVHDFGPALGFHTLRLLPYEEWAAQEKMDVATSGNSLSNALVSLTAAADGTVELNDLVEGKVYSRLAWFEDAADLGDTYDYAALKDDVPLTTLEQQAVSIATRRVSARMAEMEVTTEMLIPEDSATEGRCPAKRHTIVTVFQLVSGSACVRARTHYVNDSIHHRLRVAFTFEDTFNAFTGGHFAAVERNWTPPSEQYPCRPFTDYLHLARSAGNPRDGGLGLYTRGLYECEFREADQERHVYVTLCRSVSAVGAAAGANYPVTHAKELGPHTAEFAFGPSSSLSHTAHQAGAYVFPVVGEAHFAHTEPPSVLGSLLSVSPDDIVFTCLKRAVNEEGTIVRMFNPYPVETPVRLVYSLPYSSARRTSLSEADLGESDSHTSGSMVRDGDALQFSIGPHETATILLND